jgi:hypothetical protein
VQPQLHPSKEAKMELLTQQQREELVRNHRANEGRENTQDFQPVVKLFCPWNLAVWLLTELDPETNIAFGLCDLGVGIAELGSVSLTELASVEGPEGLRIERDTHFTPTKTLSAYAREARANQRGKR